MLILDVILNLYVKSLIQIPIMLFMNTYIKSYLLKGVVVWALFSLVVTDI